MCSYKMKTIDTDPWLNTITTTSMNTNTGVVSLRGYCTLPPATPASGGDLQMESREMCKYKYNDKYKQKYKYNYGCFDIAGLLHPASCYSC